MNSTDPTTDVHDPYKVNSLVLAPDTSPVEGHVEWNPLRSIWNGSMLIAALVLVGRPALEKRRAAAQQRYAAQARVASDFREFTRTARREQVGKRLLV